MDVVRRLEELMRLDIFDPDEQVHLSSGSAAIIVAAEIIAEAIKEAAVPPRKVEQPHKVTLNSVPVDKESTANEIKKLLKRYDEPAQ